MSKVTIRFWDKTRKAYIQTFRKLFVNTGGSVIESVSTISGQHSLKFQSDIEAHYFKDGERIDV